MQNVILEQKIDKNIQEQFASKFAHYPVEVFIQDNLKSSIDVDAHWHDCIEILYMIEGSAIQRVNGEIFTLNKNDVIILHERNIHSTFCEKHQDVKILVIKFSSSHLGGFNSGIIQSRYINAFINAGFKTPYVLTKCADNNDVFKEMMMNLYFEYSNKEAAYELYVNGYIQHIIGYLLRNNIFKAPIQNDKTSQSHKISLLLDYIEQNYYSDISLQTASEFTHISYYYLSRLFKQYTGQNFKQYLDFVRICEAEKLIIKSNKNITQIALDVGFPNISSFNRVFNRIKNYNPSDLKKAKTDKI